MIDLKKRNSLYMLRLWIADPSVFGMLISIVKYDLLPIFVVSQNDKKQKQQQQLYF